MVFFKLINKDYSNDFYNKGIIHLGTANEYRGMENHEEKKGYGDINEGTLSVGKNKYDTQICIDGIDVSTDINNVSMNSPYIFSMVGIQNINKIDRKHKSNIIKELKKGLLSDPDHQKDIFKIIHPNYFFKKMVDNIKRQVKLPQNYNIIGKKVHYSDNRNKKVANLITNNKTNLNSYDESNFVKDTFFRNQYEYRVLITGNYPQPTEISLGSLKHITQKINNFDEAFY